jgi:hypothetical protein
MWHYGLSNDPLSTIADDEIERRAALAGRVGDAVRLGACQLTAG